MKKKHLNIILALLSFCSYSANSQMNCTVPLPPALTSVSVQPETGRTELNWILSESTGIAAYIIYSYKDEAGTPIDTVWNPAAINHIISNTAPKYSSVSYVVAAYRLSAIPGLPGCISPLSNDLSTIFCKAAADTCNKRINVSWNNYPSEPKAVTSYSVMLSVNGSDFTEETSTIPGDTSFTINNFITDAEYCFYVRANLEGGSFSTSNKACVLTRMQRPPGWINADFATVNTDNKIALSFSIDPLSEITDFSLERKVGQSGTFQEIAQPGLINGSVLFTDDQADVNVVNYYRLSAINSCEIPITSSNIASNMVLSLERRGNDFILSWNTYTEWTGTISAYRLFVDTGDGFGEKAVIESTDSVYTLGYQEIMYDVSGSEVCFYISASETANPYGITGQSNSSGTCTSPIEIITVPNVFTPNADLVNDFFRPVLSFTPRDYHLIVSDQHGSVLFETRDYNASWDGSKNGKPQTQGVCLWFLKVTTPSGKSISKTGTITVIMEL